MSNLASQKRTLADHLAEPIRVGEPDVAGALTVYPLFGPPTTLDYAALATRRRPGRDHRARGRGVGQRPHRQERERPRRPPLRGRGDPRRPAEPRPRHLDPPRRRLGDPDPGELRRAGPLGRRAATASASVPPRRPPIPGCGASRTAGPDAARPPAARPAPTRARSGREVADRSVEMQSVSPTGAMSDIYETTADGSPRSRRGDPAPRRPVRLGRGDRRPDRDPRLRRPRRRLRRPPPGDRRGLRARRPRPRAALGGQRRGRRAPTRAPSAASPSWSATRPRPRTHPVRASARPPASPPTASRARR